MNELRLLSVEGDEGVLEACDSSGPFTKEIRHYAPPYGPAAEPPTYAYVETGTQEFLTDAPGIVDAFADDGYNVIDGNTDEDLVEPIDDEDVPTAVIYFLS